MTMTIGEAVTALNNAKTAIATAITTKGGTVNQGDGFSDFATDIDSIPSGGSTQNPIEVATSNEMDALIVSDNVGKVYKYTGTTGTYINGRLYIVEA